MIRLWFTSRGIRPPRQRVARAIHSAHRAELLEPRTLLSTFDVTNTNNSGDGSLRKAILDANQLPGADVIRFSIPGPGPFLIQPTPTTAGDAFTAPMPITGPVLIDGYTQSGASPNALAVGDNAQIRVQLDGGLAPAGVAGIFVSGSGVTVRGLSITRFSDGVILRDGGGNTIAGNFIGIDPAGNRAGNSANGISVEASPADTIGGTAPADRNVISANGRDGVRLIRTETTDTLIEGNFIGTDRNGTADFGNGANGVEVTAFAVADGYASRATIGGTDAGAGNLISGNTANGISLVGTLAGNNVIQHNYIGTDATGTAALPNDGNGILLSFPFSGTALSGASGNNLIGGTDDGAGNLISGNKLRGILLVGSADDNTIQGNYIGTDFTGAAAIGNGTDGINLQAADPVGVRGPRRTLIGGTQAGAGNVISGNKRDGIQITDSTTTATVVQQNRIGISAGDGIAAHDKPLGNGANGILIDRGASKNTIGDDGTETVGDPRNLIAYNTQDGVFIPTGTPPTPSAPPPVANDNRISQNLIFKNGDLPIDLAENGDTPNDPGDVDSGPQDLLNSPSVYEVKPAQGGVSVKGEYSGAPSAFLRLEFYEFRSSADRPTYLGTRVIHLDAAGHADINESFSDTPFAGGDMVRAVARDADGNTSEFSVGNVFELLARQIAYARKGQPAWTLGAPVTYGDIDLGYTVDAIFKDDPTGFYGLGLKSDTYGPALVLRGTETDPPGAMIADLFSDSDPRGVGYDQFLSKWPTVSSWLGGLPPSAPVDITGHSLGGALAQWFAAAWTSLAPGNGVVVDNVVTFNAPGITNTPNAVTGPLMTYASSFNPARANHVTHYIVNGDLVSMAGQAFIPGRVEMATYSDMNLLHNHVLPLLTPKIGIPPGDVTTRPHDLRWRSYPNTDAINQPTFGYDDADYQANLAILQTGIGLAVSLAPFVAPSLEPFLTPMLGVPALMEFRGTTEASRGLIGKFLRIVIDTFNADVQFIDQASQKVRAVLTSLVEGARRIDELTELTLTNNLNATVTTGTDGQPTARFVGGLGVNIGRGTTINLPAWLGGPVTAEHLFSLANLDSAGVIDAQGLRVNGHVSLLGGLVQVDGRATEDWSHGTVSVSGTEKLLNGMITATGSATLDSNLDLTMSGSAAVRIPAGAPYFAGANLQDASFFLSFVNDSDPADDYVEVSGGLGPLHLGLRIFFDGTWNVIGAATVPTTGGTASAGVAAASVVAAAAPPDQTFTVAPATQWALFTADWQTDSASTQLRLVTPAGVVLSEADILADPSMQIVDEMTTPTSRSVLVNNPAAGAWTVSVADATGLGAVQYHALRDGPAAIATFGNVSGGQAGAPVNIRVDVNDPTGQARVALYYDTDAAGADGVLIANGLSATAGVLNYTWRPKGVPPGEYTLYAVVTHPSAPSALVYAPAPVQLSAAPPAPSVVRRHVFYAGSALDQTTGFTTAPDEHAIGRDRIALLPGATASSGNVSSYSKGINGIIVDVANLPRDATITTADFTFRTGAGPNPATFTLAPAPTNVIVRRGGGLGGTDRITLTWPDNALRNTWLQVTVLANPRTGLSAADIFYFGNLVGDTGNDRGAPTVNATDYALTRAAVFRTDAASLNRYDFNRDGRIDAADVLIVRNNQRHSLPLFTAPVTTASAAAARSDPVIVPIVARSSLRPARRELLDGAASQ